VAASVLSGGCSARFAYEHLDKLIVWSVDDYFTFDAVQKRYLESGVDSFLYWHRKNELPVYARTLRRFATEVRDGLTLEELIALEAEIDVWAARVVDVTIPIATEILYSTTPSQRAELVQTMPRESERWIRSWLKRTPEERRERWRKEATDFAVDYIGRLADDQKALLARTAARYEPDEELWLAYRQAWQRELMRLLTESAGYGEFAARFRAHATERSRWYGADYAAAYEGNQRLYRELAISLVATMTEAQHARLEERLLSLADDLDALAADDREAPAPLGCLASCSTSGIERSVERTRVERHPRDDIRDHDELRHQQSGDDRRQSYEERVEIEVSGDPGAHTAEHRLVEVTGESPDRGTVTVHHEIPGVASITQTSHTATKSAAGNSADNRVAFATFELGRVQGSMLGLQATTEFVRPVIQDVCQRIGGAQLPVFDEDLRSARRARVTVPR
jgi:hypothetical protein